MEAMINTKLRYTIDPLDPNMQWGIGQPTVNFTGMTVGDWTVAGCEGRYGETTAR